MTTSAQLEAFLTRIPEFGPLVRAVVGTGLRMGMHVRETDRRVLIDLSADPIRVEFDPPSLSQAVVLRADAADLADLLAGRLDVMQGISQRRLLAAGGMADLVAVVPLFDLTPVLWAAAEAPAQASWLQRPVGFVARLTGQGLAGLRRDELLDGLRGLARGAGGQMPGVPASAPAADRDARPNPLDAPRAAGARRLVGPLARHGLRALGWSLATARYRFGLPLDLLSTVSRLAEGLGAAGPDGE